MHEPAAALPSSWTGRQVRHMSRLTPSQQGAERPSWLDPLLASLAGRPGLHHRHRPAATPRGRPGRSRPVRPPTAPSRRSHPPRRGRDRRPGVQATDGPSTNGTTTYGWTAPTAASRPRWRPRRPPGPERPGRGQPDAGGAAAARAPRRCGGRGDRAGHWPTGATRAIKSCGRPARRASSSTPPRHARGWPGRS